MKLPGWCIALAICGIAAPGIAMAADLPQPGRSGRGQSLRSASLAASWSVARALFSRGGVEIFIGVLENLFAAYVSTAFKDTFASEPGLIILVGALAGLGCGVIVGLVNGLCVAFLRISPFMVTLGTMSIATGFALLLTSGIPVYGMPKSYVEGFGRGRFNLGPRRINRRRNRRCGGNFLERFSGR